MRYRLYLSAWDIMDNVYVAVGVYDDSGEREDDGVRCVELKTTIRGTGESDPHEWARDALIAALESL